MSVHPRLPLSGSPPSSPRPGLPPRPPRRPSRRALSLVSALPRPAFRAEGRVEGRGLGGGARARAFALGAGRLRSPRRPRGALPRRVSGCAARRRAAVAPSGVGSAPSPWVGLRAPARAGRLPSAASRRLPWTGVSRSVGRLLRPCCPPRSASLPSGLAPHPPPRASGPAPAPRLPRLCSPPRALPARAPLPAAAPTPRPPGRRRWGPGSRVRGGTWVGGSVRWASGAFGKPRGGPVRPRRGPWGGDDGLGGKRAVSGVGGGGAGGGAPAGAVLRHGPAASGFPGAAGLAAAGVGVEAVARGPVSPPNPRLACPPPPVQVPSAFRRGGLKTLWGSPVRLGSGRSGPWGGGGSLLPQTPPPASPAPGAGVAAPRHGLGVAAGRGLPGGPSGRARARAPRALGVWRGGARQAGTPWAPVGFVRARPSPLARRWPDAPVVQPFRPSRSVVSFVLDLAGRRHPCGGVCCAEGGASPPGVGPPRTIKTRTTLSGGVGS